MIPGLLLLASYLLGAIPTGYLAGRWTRGIDLREHGSGNLGATNTFRVLGARIAAPVMLVDVAKGFIPAALFPLWDGVPEWGWALAYGAAIYWFRHVELFVDRHGIERHWRMLGFAGTRRLAAGDIVDIKSKITAEANDTPYHTVFAVVPDGKEVALVSNLRTRDAAHVVEEIGNSLGSASPVAR